MFFTIFILLKHPQTAPPKKLRQFLITLYIEQTIKTDNRRSNWKTIKKTTKAWLIEEWQQKLQVKIVWRVMIQLKAEKVIQTLPEIRKFMKKKQKEYERQRFETIERNKEQDKTRQEQDKNR